MTSRTLPKLSGAPRLNAGRFCDIYYDERIDDALAAIYGRDGLCLKAFREFDTWEGQPLRDVTIMQNIGAAHGVAPRVYDLVTLDNGRPAQVTDYRPVRGEPTLRAIGALIDVLLAHEVGTTKLVSIGGRNKWDILAGMVNWSGDLFLDWGGYCLTKPEGYVAELRERISVEIGGKRRGLPVVNTYQAVEGFGIAGSRDTEHRVNAMRLSEIDFQGKTVLDLGANLGAFSFYAHDHGAKRVTAVEQRLGPVLVEKAGKK